MYVSKDGTQSIDSPIYVVGDDRDRLHPNYFECDSLMVPIIMELNKKGYKTKYCCSGHLSNNTIIYPFENDLSPAVISNDPIIAQPYIMFDGNFCDIETFVERGLPDHWVIENMVDDKVIVVNRENYKKLKIKNFTIRRDMGDYSNSIEYYAGEEEAFNFYEKLIGDLRELYKWFMSKY